MSNREIHITCSDENSKVLKRTYNIFIKNNDAIIDNEQRHGYATICFSTVQSLEDTKFFRTNNVLEQCLSMGLISSDLLTHIKMFYPNGDYPKEENLGKGVGTMVLERIVKDSESLNSKILYVLSTTDNMETFLLARKFTRCAIFNNQFFKKI